MKYIKITLIAFIFTTILSTTLVNAIAIKGIAGLEIPNFGQIVSTDFHQKEAEESQQFSLVKCTENITGKETPVEVRTYFGYNGDYSNWKTAIKGSTVVIDNDEHKVPGFYKLNARAIDSNNWLTSSLYGTWILG